MENKISSLTMMKKFIMIILALIFWDCTNPELFDENPSISGRVLNAETGDPIPGATVYTEPATSLVSSDNQGFYKISNIKPGNYKIIAEKTGFQKGITTVRVGSENAVADIQLKPLKPALYVSARNLDFGTDITSKQITISNIGSGTLDWNASKTADWLSISPESGSLTAGASVIMTVKIRRDNLPAGNYYDVIKLTSNGGNEDITVLMSVKNPAQPQLTVIPSSIEFKVNESEKILTLKNTGTGGPIQWQAATDANWLLLSKTSGTFSTEDTLKVTALRMNLNDGFYYGNIRFTSNAGNQSVNVTLWVQRANPLLWVYPDYLDFDSTKSMMIFSIRNTGSGILTWTLSASHNWIFVNPSSGTNDMDVSVFIDRNKISEPGTYNGLINVNSNSGSKSISVRAITPKRSGNEWQSGALKIIIESFKRISSSDISIDITFQNLTDLTNGRTLRVLVEKSESYLVDESSWRWDLTGDSQNFTYQYPGYFNYSGATVAPGTKLRSTFYFKPSANSPNSGKIFTLKLTIKFAFDGEQPVVEKIKFENLQ